MGNTADDIVLGRILGPWGVWGMVRIKNFAADPKSLMAYGPLHGAPDARGVRPTYQVTVHQIKANGLVLAKIAGITDRTMAEKLKGVLLYINSAQLPPPAEDEFYYKDLIGLQVRAEDGTVLGTVQTVANFGGGDFVEVKRDTGKVFTVPFTKKAVPVVKAADGYIVVHPDFILE